jgi:hypothetical protein
MKWLACSVSENPTIVTVNTSILEPDLLGEERISIRLRGVFARRSSTTHPAREENRVPRQSTISAKFWLNFVVN